MKFLAIFSLLRTPARPRHNSTWQDSLSLRELADLPTHHPRRDDR